MRGGGEVLLQRVLAANSQEELVEVVAADLDRVLADFAAWTTVPRRLRGDPAATNAYVQRLVVVAQLLAEGGHPEPLGLLIGGADDPLHRWGESFQDSRALAAAGRYQESLETLHAVLAELEQATGPAVDDLRAKLFGALGADWFAAGDLGEARRWTDRALQACRDNGDTAGVIAYFENRQVLEALHLPAVDPEAGALLLSLRRLVASAQQRSDGFDYRGSNARLEEALSMAERVADRTTTRLHGKIYGLRGWNHHQMGDDDRARTDTERAVSECQAAGDVHGVRMYAASLRLLAR